MTVRSVNTRLRRAHRVSGRRRGRWLIAALGFASLLAAPPVGAAAYSASLLNATNVFSSGTLQLESQTTSTCYSTGSGAGGLVESNSAQCLGSPLPSGQLTTSSVLSATSTISDVGTATPETASISLLSCGSAEVADSSSATNTGLLYGSVSYGAPFTSPQNSGFTSNGVSLGGGAGTYIGTTESLTSPSSFTLVTWVKTTATSGGGIVGFSDVQPDVGSSRHDRMLWVEPSGVVAFGVQGAFGMLQIASTVKVNDGAWHFVAASLSSTGLSLDVDGSVTTGLASSPIAYSGYWHLGWAGDAAWTNPGTDEYLAGSLFGVAVFPLLSTANLTTLEDSSSAASYAATETSLVPSADWLLSDSGATPYTGVIPALGTNRLCGQVLIDIQTTQGSTVACVYPSAARACASTPPSGAVLSSLTTTSMAPASSMSVSLLIRMTLSVPSVAGVIGLHLLPDIALSDVVATWSANLGYPSALLEM